jgi:hypothetical protein
MVSGGAVDEGGLRVLFGVPASPRFAGLLAQSSAPLGAEKTRLLVGEVLGAMIG